MENNRGYPNLMCFGQDLSNCPCQDDCPDYQDCKEEYHERYFSFMASKDSEEK